MSKKLIVGNHHLDSDGNPAGGITTGVGICINWQVGPLGRGEERKDPNGAFVEGVIEAAIDRLEFYQRSKFSCTENASAITYLDHAMQALIDRTLEREERRVEGTHAV